MKKTLSLFLIICLTFILFSSCNKPTSNGTLTLVIANEEETVYTVDYKSEDITNGLFSILDLLNITYTESGGFLNSVGDLVPQPPEYIYIYTSVAEDMDVSSYALTLEYGGKALTSAGVGAKDLHIKDGATIYIGTITY